jgi:predicted lipoprotein with Yx(FWY)xxD motif
MPINHRAASPTRCPALARHGRRGRAVLADAIFLLHPPKLHAAGTSGTPVSTAKIGLGRILVDSSGRTLYPFGKDTKGKSACSGKCASY